MADVKCGYCRTNLPDKARYCFQCGATVSKHFGPETIALVGNSTAQCARGRVLVGVDVFGSREPKVIVRAPGQIAVAKRMEIGDSLEYDARAFGRFEVSLLSIDDARADGTSDWASESSKVRTEFLVHSQDTIQALADELIASTLSLPSGPEPFGNREPIFSDEEEVPFSPDERRLLAAALSDAKQAIRDTFQPAAAQQAEVEQKLDYLTQKVDQLDKFNWKRLCISTLVGVSVDLCLGTVVPPVLLGIFKDVLNHVLEKRKSLPSASPS